MKTTTLANVTTFAGSVVIGFGAALAIASAAAVSHAAPSLRAHEQPAPIEVVRLEPVVVTVSKATYDAIRNEGTQLVRGNEVRKVTRG